MDAGRSRGARCRCSPRSNPPPPCPADTATPSAPARGGGGAEPGRRKSRKVSALNYDFSTLQLLKIAVAAGLICLLGPTVCGQLNGKGGALAHRALDAQFPAMTLNHVFDNRQPQAGSRGGLVGPHAALQNDLSQSCGEPRSIVVDRDEQSLRLGIPSRGLARRPYPGLCRDGAQERVKSARREVHRLQRGACAGRTAACRTGPARDQPALRRPHRRQRHGHRRSVGNRFGLLRLHEEGGGYREHGAVGTWDPPRDQAGSRPRAAKSASSRATSGLPVVSSFSP